MAKTIKGYTVHLEVESGKTACGTTPRTFLGKPSVSKNPRCVTCPKCQKAGAR